MQRTCERSDQQHTTPSDMHTYDSASQLRYSPAAVAEHVVETAVAESLQLELEPELVRLVQPLPKETYSRYSI